MPNPKLSALALRVNRQLKHMDIKHIIIKLACDADLRQRFIRSVGPGCLADYYLSSGGQILTRGEWHWLQGLKLYFDSSGMIGSAIRNK